MTDRLRDKTALITEAGQGNGRAIALAFLASDESRFVTGQAVILHGGITL